MSGNPTGSDYLLQKAIFKEMAKPSSEGSQANTAQPIIEHAAGQAASGADAARFASNLSLQQAALQQRSQQSDATRAEGQRQFLTQILASREKLATWSKQNDLATWIAAANIPIQALAMKKQSDSLDKQEAMNQELMTIQKKNAETSRMATLGEIARFKDYQSRQRMMMPDGSIYPQ